MFVFVSVQTFARQMSDMKEDHQDRIASASGHTSQVAKNNYDLAHISGRKNKRMTKIRKVIRQKRSDAVVCV